MPALRSSSEVASIRTMIREEILSAAFRHDMQSRLRDHSSNQRHPRTLYQQIIRLRFRPQSSKLRIVDEHVWGVRRVRPILEIRLPAIQQQGSPIRVEEDGRERVVGVVLDKLTGRRPQ